MRRRKWLQSALVAAAPGTAGAVSHAPTRDAAGPLLARPIPASGERIPAVGLGTWLTFDVPIGDAAALARRQAVAERFFALGGRVVDSSPMYGHAEAVLGEVLPRDPARTFAVGKVWTPAAPYGPTQMRRSMALWRRARMDVMLVHNLLAWRGHLATLRQWQADGRVRYIGVSTSHGRAHDEMREVLASQRLDVMQITYSPVDRSAEPLLELAAARGVAVMVNRPFDGGDLLHRLERVPLPPLAADLGCGSWATLVLKWELAHPAVTVAIPATTDPEHAAQNLAALRGPLPDDRQRDAILRAMAPALG
jgi:diketogulonate reductase-like aldo/keto reductase